MKALIPPLLLLFASFAFADPPVEPLALAEDRVLDEQQFLREYPMGVHRHRMDGGGKVYGWRLRDNVTLGRLKGESDEFGFSFELNPHERIEITTGGLRWRRALGGSR